MVTFIYSPWGIPANYRIMQGSGVNTYKWVNHDGEAVLIKYHWEPKQGIKNLTQEEANEIQKTNRSEEHTSELQSRGHLVCRLLLEKKKKKRTREGKHTQ